MRVRRVLLIHDYADAQGGAEILMHDLRSALRRRGVDARLMASRVRDASPSDDAERAPAPDWEFRGSVGRLRALREALNPSLVITLRRALRSFRPDVVHLGMIFTQVSPWVLPLVRDLPVVWLPHTYRAICPTGTRMLPNGERCVQRPGRSCVTAGCCSSRGLAPRLVQLGLTRRWRSAIDHTVVPSAALASELRAHGWCIDSVCAHGTALDVPVQRLHDEPIIAYAGRLSPEKGVATLLAAFRLLHDRRPDTRLVIAGDGPLRHDLAQQVHRWGGTVAAAVEFAGHLDRAAVQRRLSGAWVQVVPSLWPEPFGLVTIEAMARGRVVVASRVGAQPEIIEDSVTGKLVPPGNPAALAAVLQQLIADRGGLERMGERARAAARERFDLEQMADRYIALYQQLLQRQERSA